MPNRITPQAVERARRSIEAADVFLQHAPVVAQACADASDGEIVVALVGHDNTFLGVHVVPIMRLYSTVMEYGAESWSLIFSAGTGILEIEMRCKQMKKYAEARYRLARRISQR